MKPGLTAGTAGSLAATKTDSRRPRRRLRSGVFAALARLQRAYRVLSPLHPRSVSDDLRPEVRHALSDRRAVRLRVFVRHFDSHGGVGQVNLDLPALEPRAALGRLKLRPDLPDLPAG